MSKSYLSRFCGSRWAIREDSAEVLAGSFLDWNETRKENGAVKQNQIVDKREDGISVIHIDGPLSYKSSFWSAIFGLDTYDSINDAIDAALNDESVMGIVLDINSPGGEVSGVADVANKIFKARGSKPYGIVARTGGLMCSAAYWIGSACEKVYTAENGTLGSIGVLCSFTKFSDDVGIKVKTIVSDLSPNKVADPDDEKGLKLIKKELNDLASVFIGAVAKHRGTTAEDVKENYGRGGVFIGQNAVDAGLADGVASLDEIFENMKKTTGVKIMPTNTQATEQVDVDALKKSAVAEERARVKAIGDVFAGLSIEQSEIQAFIDEGKTVAEAKDFAFDKMKAMLGEKDKEIEALKTEKPKANAEVVEANKKLLENENKSAASVEGGSQVEADKAFDAAIAAAFAAGMKGEGK